MADKLTRRDFALKAAGVAAGLAAAPLLKAQSPPPEKPPVSDAEVQDVQNKVAKPFTEEEKKILKDDLSSQKSDTKRRLEFKLPENSEPCFLFIATPHKAEEGR